MRFIKLIVLACVFLSLFGSFAALADTPICQELVDDPTIATCTCICESGSPFPGCLNQEAGATTPTPDQCPDMLQGRRVLSAGDTLMVADPHDSGSGTDARVLLYKTENDPDNAGIAIVDGTPDSTTDQQIPCQKGSSVAFPQQTRFAHLFDLPYAMVVTMRPTTDENDVNSSCGSTGGHNFVLDVSSFNDGAPTVPPITVNHSPDNTQLAIADFDYDGFDDVFFINRTSIQIFTAHDTSDPTQGMRSVGGLSTTLPTGAHRAPINEPTTGDFNGDGLLDVAWIGGDFPNHAGILSVFFATVCPGPVTGTLCDGANTFDLILDPGGASTIELDNAPTTDTECGVVLSASKVSIGLQNSLRAGAVTLGNFEDNGINPRGAPIDELVVTYVSGSKATGSDQCSLDVQYWSTPDQNTPGWAQKRDTVTDLFPQIHQGASPTISVYAQSAYLDWYGTVEQAVIGVSGQATYGGGFWLPITVGSAATIGFTVYVALMALLRADSGGLIQGLLKRSSA